MTRLRSFLHPSLYLFLALSAGLRTRASTFAAVSPGTKNRRLVACALVAAMVASLVPHQVAHAEVADHAAAATEAAALVAQTGIELQGCPDGGAGACLVSGLNVSVGLTIGIISVTIDRTLTCVVCDCGWVYTDDNGFRRYHREHWVDCNLQ
ncbi:hypothetical protein [Candidatus Palauibacter sp.]|uniref:hypothetical protein n=1 Tax=Candidatus Palauibacter sp. TaxID=3101350 RepID=UPI003AF22657